MHLSNLQSEAAKETLLTQSAAKILQNLPGHKVKTLPLPQLWVAKILQIPEIRSLFDLRKATRENSLPPTSLFLNLEGLSLPQIEKLTEHHISETLLVISPT